MHIDCNRTSFLYILILEHNRDILSKKKIQHIFIVIAVLLTQSQLLWLPGLFQNVGFLTFRHRASCILGQAFHYSPENAFYIFNQQIYFIILYLLDRASLI